MLSKEEILKIAKLSRLKISDAEIESFSGRLDQLLHYMGCRRCSDGSSRRCAAAVVHA